MPRLLRAAAIVEATAVPCHSPSTAGRTFCGFSSSTPGRSAKSGCVMSRPESITRTPSASPPGGGSRPAVPTASNMYWTGRSGSGAVSSAFRICVGRTASIVTSTSWPASCSAARSAGACSWPTPQRPASGYSGRAPAARMAASAPRSTVKT